MPKKYLNFVRKKGKDSFLLKCWSFCVRMYVNQPPIYIQHHISHKTIDSIEYYSAVCSVHMFIDFVTRYPRFGFSKSSSQSSIWQASYSLLKIVLFLMHISRDDINISTPKFWVWKWQNTPKLIWAHLMFWSKAHN